MSHCCSFCDRRWHSPRRLYRSLRLHVPIPATFRTFPVVSDAIAFSERTAVDCVPLELIASGAGQWYVCKSRLHSGAEWRRGGGNSHLERKRPQLPRRARNVISVRSGSVPGICLNLPISAVAAAPDGGWRPRNAYSSLDFTRRLINLHWTGLNWRGMI